MENIKLILKGNPASPGIATGPVKVILSAREIHRIEYGDVLVAPHTSPDYVPAMRRASAIVTDHGGVTSHAAIVAREFGIPCVVGASVATGRLKTDLLVTVNGATGEVFRGRMVGAVTKPLVDYSPSFYKTKTKLYVNLAEPERAEEVAKMDVDGVGLLRAEFIIAQIGTHPKRIIKDGKQNIFINKLAENLKIFCEQFNPRPVIYRLSDFKTNEYRNLKGGSVFEPEEENPMLGFRGAYRFIKDPQVLKLEVEAIKKVRNTYGFKNLWVMVPYVRTVNELIKIKKLLSSFGLVRSSSFKLWMMVEIPSNVILLEDFLAVGLDGISIGSNDLTMLTLGTDRDNSELATVFDERDPAVLRSIEKVIKTCRKFKVSSSICGQAPSTYPEIVENLVRLGIASISINSDGVVNARETVYNSERKIQKKSIRKL